MICVQAVAVFKVIARDLGPGCGAQLRRQAAWRLDFNRDGVVELVAPCMQLL